MLKQECLAHHTLNHQIHTYERDDEAINWPLQNDLIIYKSRVSFRIPPFQEKWGKKSLHLFFEN
jgi:hypothetical protein